MLPGFSSKNNFNGSGGAKKIKQKEYFHHVNENDEVNEILLQYSLEKMDEHHYDFHHCDTHRESYPFASSLSKNTDFDSLLDIVDTTVTTTITTSYDFEEEEGVDHDGESESIEINICTYQINTSCKLPFIEYLMILSDDVKPVFEFPKFEYILTKRKSVEEQAEEYVVKLLGDDAKNHVIKFRGIFKDISSLKRNTNIKTNKQSVYFFFQKFFKTPKHPPQLSKRDHVWWVVASEIVNFKKVMYMDVDPVITDLFVKNPEIMQLYDCKGKLLETPTICYFGDEFQKIKYLAFFGLLKAPVKSSFGPFYVATNFLSSMKYACYTHNQQPFELYGGKKITSGEYGKYKEGGVLRMVLFIGKMKVFLRDGPPDDSQISQELAKTDKTTEQFMSLRDSNGNWTEEYDTAYKGLHFASTNDDVAVNPVEWFFKDYSHFFVISYHNMDTTSIPEKFDVDYTGYKLK